MTVRREKVALHIDAKSFRDDLLAMDALFRSYARNEQARRENPLYAVNLKTRAKGEPQLWEGDQA